MFPHMATEEISYVAADGACSVTTQEASTVTTQEIFFPLAVGCSGHKINASIEIPVSGISIEIMMEISPVLLVHCDIGGNSGAEV